MTSLFKGKNHYSIRALLFERYFSSQKMNNNVHFAYIQDPLKRGFTIQSANTDNTQSLNYFPPNLFRGQNFYYEDCKPSIARYSDDFVLFKKLCQRVSFEIAIDDHPKVKFSHYNLDNKFEPGVPFIFDKEALSQHYGFPTDLIDFSSSPNVAAFFATNRSDSGQTNFIPIDANKSKGYLYVFNNELFIIDETSGCFCPQELPIRSVGWQVFYRPDIQRSFVLKIKPQENLNDFDYVNCIEFQQKGFISRKYSKDFQEGKLLLEEDIDLRNLISIVNSEQFEFTNREVNSAYNLAEPWLKNSSLTKEKLIKGSRIKVNNNRTKFRWWCEIDEDSLKKWFFSELPDLHTILCKDEYN